jgi:hypothetical protein
MLSEEATNTNFIVFGLTRSGLEPTIYHTRFEHANNYTTDTVIYSVYKLGVYISKIKKTINSFIILLIVPSQEREWLYTVKTAHVVTPIKQSPVLKDHLLRVP